jgi:hypothetical protein
VIPFIAFFGSNMVVYWAGWDTDYQLFLAIVLGLILLAAGRLAGPEHFPRMDMRAGAWVLPWLGGLALISYFGSYGTAARHDYGLGAGALITLGLSLLVYVGAYTLRLPGDRVRALIRPDAAEAKEPEPLSP